MDYGPSSADEYTTKLKQDMESTNDLAEDLQIKMGQCEGRRLKLFRTIDAALAVLDTNGDDAQKMASVQWGELADIRTGYQGIADILDECVALSQKLSELIREILRHCNAIATLCEASMEIGQHLHFAIYQAARSTLGTITFLSKEAFNDCQKYCGQLEATVRAVKARQTSIATPQGDTVALLVADLKRFSKDLNALKIASLGTPFNLQIENLKARLRFAKAIVETLQ